MTGVVDGVGECLAEKKDEGDNFVCRKLHQDNVGHRKNDPVGILFYSGKLFLWEQCIMLSMGQNRASCSDEDSKKVALTEFHCNPVKAAAMVEHWHGLWLKQDDG
ncbi:hypothetical protein K443DRAFT_120590 [Laccaria amethystina LaAM-08-1]|uniref:Uncharacterized protein n=1 Tax=Laccaria amethystina LaAM-08-1 TaxID=1095629 RepID=A0A0C9YB05_9AGAR|nr:hypothetical protein K443DRAFT_120590 [Laccaria amethystina LaAM-08-1]